jgi:hypothetical protein
MEGVVEMLGVFMLACHPYTILSLRAVGYGSSRNASMPSETESAAGPE